MQALVYGVGINDCYGWASSWRTAGKEDLKFRIYHLWHRMLQRVYSAQFHIKNPFYMGRSVCERWHRLSLFAEDIKKLPNFELWAASPNGRVMLDKDTLVTGNKEYSPATCCFLTAEESSRDVGIRHREEARALGKNPLIIAKRAAKNAKQFYAFVQTASRFYMILVEKPLKEKALTIPIYQSVVVEFTRPAATGVYSASHS